MLRTGLGIVSLIEQQGIAIEYPKKIYAKVCASCIHASIVNPNICCYDHHEIKNIHSESCSHYKNHI